MKTIQCIDAICAQDLKELAQSYGLTATIKPQPNIVQGYQRLIEIEGSADRFILFGRDERLRGISPQPALFSKWHTCKSRIKRLRRVLSNGLTFDGEPVTPSEIKRKLRNLGIDEYGVKAISKKIIKRAINPSYPNGRNVLQITYPGGGQDRKVIGIC